MAYPKPLSWVSIDKICREYGLNSTLVEKLVEEMYYWDNFSDNPIYDAMNYLEEVEFIFKNDVQLNRFMKHYSDFINNSHLWSNFGYTLHDM